MTKSCDKTYAYRHRSVSSSSNSTVAGTSSFLQINKEYKKILSHRGLLNNLHWKKDVKPATRPQLIETASQHFRYIVYLKILYNVRSK